MALSQDEYMKIDTLAARLASHIQPWLAEDEMWLPINRYCRVHGLSEKTVRRAIEQGVINESNEGLAPGGELPKARKRIHKFFDIHVGCVRWPGASCES